MKQNQKNRFNGRYNGRNSRAMLTRNTALESTGPMGKLHGTALQLFEKYQAYAKDALIQNDLILAQTCMQYADHYLRMQSIAIANEQAMRTNNIEQRANTTTNNDDKTEDDSLPDVHSTAIQEEKSEEGTVQAESESVEISKKTEETPESEKKTPKKTFIIRRKSRSVPKKEETEESALSDDSVLKQDLSVPVSDMQENNQ